MKSIEFKKQGGGVFRSFSEAGCCSRRPPECCSRQLPCLQKWACLYNMFILSLRYNGLCFAPLKQLGYASLLCGQGLAPYLGLSMFAAVSTINDAGSGFPLLRLNRGSFVSIAAILFSVQSTEDLNLHLRLRSLTLLVCHESQPSLCFQHISKGFCHRLHGSAIQNLYYFLRSTLRVSISSLLPK